MNGIPRTAVAPLFIVWLGIGLWSKVGVVFLLTFFLNFFNTYTGMRQMDHEYIDLANLMGVKGWKLTFKVIFPAISPYVFTGIRASMPLAVIGAIVGVRLRPPKAFAFSSACRREFLQTANIFVGIIVYDDGHPHGSTAELIEKRALHWQTQTEHIQMQA